MISRTDVLVRWALVSALALGCSEVDHANSPSAPLGGNSSTGIATSGGQTTRESASARTAYGSGGTIHSLGGATGTLRTIGGASSAGGPSGGGTSTASTATGGESTNTGGRESGGATSAASSTGGTPGTVATGGRGDSGGVHHSGGNATSGGVTSGISSATGGTVTGGTASGSTHQAHASGGTDATGGATPGAGGTSSGGTTPGGSQGFVLAWEDDFDVLDSSAWQLMTHSWDGNLAQFSTSNVSVAAGILSIHLTSAAGDTAKPYRGVEMRSTKTLTYGKVSARIRFAKGSGVVSALVTIYTPWPADNWNEIDIEHLGKSPTSSQLNCMVYTGPSMTPPVTQSVTPTQDPLLVSPGFDAETAFHQYDIEWTDTAVRTLIDGSLVRTWTKEIARMTLPQNILFTIWASSSADWAGALTSTSAPTTAEIDWIRVYDWKR